MSKEDIFNKIIATEGGYINHPADKGGPTRWGITEKVARMHGYTGSMENLPRKTALVILDNVYWSKPGLNKIVEVSPDIAYKLCDAGVNMGPQVPVKWLQRWLNVFSQQQHLYPLLNEDAHIGPATLHALSTFISARGHAGEVVMVKALNCTQGTRYLELTEKRPENQAFIYGWINERITL